jgi:hypothetical protein
MSGIWHDLETTLSPFAMTESFPVTALQVQPKVSLYGRANRRNITGTISLDVVKVVFGVATLILDQNGLRSIRFWHLSAAAASSAIEKWRPWLYAGLTSTPNVGIGFPRRWVSRKFKK